MPSRRRHGGKIDRVTLPLIEEHEQARVGHPLRVENAVEMVAFVLHDAGVEAFDLALDRLAVRRRAAITDASVARHRAAQAGDRQATLPAELDAAGQRLD